MDKIVYIAILVILGIFCIVKMFNPSVGLTYTLKTIALDDYDISKLKENTLGELRCTVKTRRKFILPTEMDLWSEVNLFENGILLKRNKEERIIFFHELFAIRPYVINSLLAKAKYFGYELILRNGEKINIESHNLPMLDEFTEKLYRILSSKREV